MSFVEQGPELLGAGVTLESRLCDLPEVKGAFKGFDQQGESLFVRFGKG
jgi:hypothetical protein